MVLFSSNEPDYNEYKDQLEEEQGERISGEMATITRKVF
jgi:hypothetical protein